MEFTSLNKICDTIDKLNYHYQLDYETKDVSTLKLSDANNILVLLSKDLFENVSNKELYPEKIVCVLKFPSGRHLIIEKNREYDYERLVRFNMTRDPDDDNDCHVCMNQIEEKVNKKCCVYCSCVLCSSCCKTLVKHSMLKCPLCNTWSLQGNRFGCPFEDNKYIPMPKNLWTTQSEFKKVLESLDGYIEIVYSIDHEFNDHTVLKMCRFPFTNRYSKKYMKPRDIASHLGNIYEKKCRIEKRLFNVYVLRETSQTRDGKAMLEISSFRWTHNKLVQYPNDAWEDIFFQISCRYKKKVEYIFPARFEFPKHFVRLLEDLQKDYPCYKEVYMINTDDNCNKKYDMIFNIDEQGQIAEEKQFIIARYMSELIERYNMIYLQFHLFPDLDGLDTEPTDILTYKMSSRSCMKLTQRENVNFCKRYNDIVVGIPI